MISRIVEISIPGFLSVKDRQLVVEKDGEVKGTVPIEDLASSSWITQPSCIPTNSSSTS
ncbi:MAG: hypothetical protein K6T17_07515 [Fimbriimonadales bacterium]|nr:hypothetical protein [Fimbriimonadales bacterium]